MTQHNDLPQYVFEMKQKCLVTGQRSYYVKGKYQVKISEDKKFDKIVWNKQNQESTHVIHNSNLLQQIINRFQHEDCQLESQHIDCITIINVMDSHDTIKYTYRADPYFFKRPWHDWCVTNWDIDDTNVAEFPS